MSKGIISIEYLTNILILIVVVIIFYNVLHKISLQSSEHIQRAILIDKASSTSLLVTIYSYSLKHGDYDLNITCSVGSKVYCIDNESHVGYASVYRRKGGGN